MLISYLVLSLLGFLSGLCSAYLGVGGSLFIVPLLPLLVGLSALETLQISLFLILVMSLLNTLSFIYQKLVLWSWVFSIILSSLGMAFVSSFFTRFMNETELRFILWLFLFFMLALPLLVKRIFWLQTRKGVYAVGSLMGLCVGLTGLGGGFIISPYFHESKLIPTKNVSAVVCVAMFCTSLVAIFSWISGMDFSFSPRPFWWFCYGLLLVASVLGLAVGLYFNLKDQYPIRRRFWLRLLLILMFLQVSGELISFY